MPIRTVTRMSTGATLIAAVVVSGLGVPARAEAQRGEQGVFILSKLGQRIGREEYRVDVSAAGRILTDTFEFTDRGGRVPLKTEMGFGPNGDPRWMAIRGMVSRMSPIDDSVSIEGDSAAFRHDQTTTRLPRPRGAFAIAGYAPMALQQELVRFWLRRGRPAIVPLLPRGAARLRTRGTDMVMVAGRRKALTRIDIDGLIWGHETVWIEPGGSLAAVVTVDAEFDRVEGVREAYDAWLPRFVEWAAKDAAAILAGQLGGTAQPRRPIAIVGATLIDGLGGPPIANATVLVRGAQIVAAGHGIPVPAGAEIFDGTGKTVLPGLWDSHAHYGQVEWGPIYLAAGVTTARDVGNEFDFITAVRDAIDAGRGLGPRLVLAGEVDGTSPVAIGTQRVDTPEMVAAVVAKHHAAGFRQMKIYSSVRPEMVKAVAAEAHRLGMSVTGHIPDGMNAIEGVEAGMDQINHIWNIVPLMQEPADSAGRVPPLDVGSPRSTKVIEFLRSHGTVVDPTLAIFEWLLHPRSVAMSTFEPGIDKVAQALYAPITHVGVEDVDSASASQEFRGYVAAVGALHRAGIPIIGGTDQVVPGHSLHRELELYVAAGFTPLQAIAAATTVPAKVLGLDREVGTIVPGMRADLLVVDGNPAERISDIRRVWLVVANGRPHRPGPLWRSVGFRP